MADTHPYTKQNSESIATSGLPRILTISLMGTEDVCSLDKLRAIFQQ